MADLLAQIFFSIAVTIETILFAVLSTFSPRFHFLWAGLNADANLKSKYFIAGSMPQTDHSDYLGTAVELSDFLLEENTLLIASLA